MPIFDPTSSVSLAVQEAKLLHPGLGKKTEYFAVAKKSATGDWYQTFHKLSDLEKVVQREVDTSQNNLYISQALFGQPNRLSRSASSIRSVFVDLDSYVEDRTEEGIRAYAELIKSTAESLKIPEPSYIVSSGLGFYAKWVFEEPIGKSQFKDWRKLLKRILNAYLHMDADTKVTDLSRVLRITDSKNIKEEAKGAIVRILSESKLYKFKYLFEATKDLKEYSSDAINAQAKKKNKEKAKKEPKNGPKKEARIKQIIRILADGSNESTDESIRTDLSRLDAYVESREPKLYRRISIQRLGWQRFLDLKKLIDLRDGVQRGSRDIFFFWMVNFLIQAKVINEENFLHEVTMLLASFPVGRDFNPLQDGTLGTLYRKAFEKDKHSIEDESTGIHSSKYYTPTTDDLRLTLLITSEEEMVLSTIISKEEKLRRADEKCYGRAWRRAHRQDSLEVATSFKNQGMSITNIAKVMKRNKSTVSRWFKPIPEERISKDYVERRGRKPFKNVETHITCAGVAHVEKTRSAAQEAHAIDKKTRKYEQKPHLRKDHGCWSISRVQDWMTERNLGPQVDSGVPLVITKASMQAAVAALLARVNARMDKS